MTFPKPNNIVAEKYVAGMSLFKSKLAKIKLSANESALGPSPKAKKEYINVSKSFARYPDSDGTFLRKTLSNKFKLDSNRIILGSGSDQIFELICKSFLKKGDEVIVPKYSFIIYRIYSKMNGAKVVYSKENNFRVSVNEILKKVSKKTKIVFLANPNNPTGTYISKKELLDLRKKLRQNVLLVVDDAYFEYMLNKDYKSGLDLFKNKNNVFILRTFSKIYGLAALRVGWGYGDKKIIKELYKIKPPFNVNKIAQICAKESLTDRKFLQKSVNHNIFWCKRIKKEFEKYNISTNDIGPNFFLLNFSKCKLSAEKVEKKLEKYGIILREMKSYGIKNCLRLTIGSKKENIFLLNKMKSIFKHV
jgi:histidinol-phosphate aminotransferase